MKENTLLNDTLELVRHYHKGQEYNGKNYVDAHLIPVAEKAKALAETLNFSKQETFKAQTLGLLHDVLEDTALSEQALEQLYGSEMLTLCKALCNKRSDGLKKTKEEYYAEIAKYPLAKLVKTADRVINVSKLKLLDDDKKRNHLTQKYLKELDFYKQYDIYPNLIEQAFTS